MADEVVYNYKKMTQKADKGQGKDCEQADQPENEALCSLWCLMKCSEKTIPDPLAPFCM